MKPLNVRFKTRSVLLTLLLHVLLPKRAIWVMAIAMLASLCMAGSLNAYVFEDGFESGDMSAWAMRHSQPGDSVSVQPGAKYEGNFGVRCKIDGVLEGGEAWVTTTLPAQNKYYTRVYFFFPSSVNIIEHLTLSKYSHSSWSNLISTAINSDMKLYMWNSIGNEAYGWNSTPVVSKDTWHSIEMMADVAAGEARVWLDGNLIIDATGINLGSNPIDRLCTGLVWAQPKLQANYLFIDNVAVDTQYLGGGGALASNPSSMDIFVGSSENAAISGGTGPYSVISSDDSVATVAIGGSTVTVTGVAEGTATITVTDVDSNTIDIDVTVTQPLAVTPTNVSMYPGQSTVVTVSGGSPGYTVTTGNTLVAQPSISGTEVTILATGAGSVTVTITDGDNNNVYVSVLVGDSIAPGLGPCPAPPFTTATLGPNVLILFDTSGSMDEDDGDGVTRFAEARAALLDFLAANKNIRFGLMRIDGTPWVDSGRPGGVVGKHNAIKGGRLLVPTGFSGSFATSADYIINYINTHMSAGVYDWRDDTGARHWTNLAESLADAGRYFATVIDSEGNRVSKGPAGFSYYKEGTDYTFYYDYDNDSDLDPFLASITDDHGTPIDSFSPIQFSCEQSFVIMFTDGQANCDNDWDLVTDVIGDYDGDGDSRDCKRADPEVIRPGISDPNNSAYGKPLDGAVYPCDTRGNPNGDNEDGNTRYLDDVAAYLYDNDLRSDIPGKQNVITYTIGFYLNDQSLLQDTAANGGGTHYNADSISSLTNALQTAIEDILLRVASGTAVSTITTSESTPDYLVRAKFLPGTSWQGFMQLFELPYSADDDSEWEAGSLLNARVASNGYADRKIYTFLSSQNPKKQLFVSADGAVKTRLAELWSVSNSETADIINYIRGDTTYDGDKYKERNSWLLGDIVYSTPVSVGPPRGWVFGKGLLNPDDTLVHPEMQSYLDYQSDATHSSRKTMIYVGANDGMLHAFDAANGQEDWAFIPENVQAKLKDLIDPDCHKYFVDLTPHVKDAWVGGSSDDPTDHSFWRTVLIGGNRFGGEEYFALDVTNPAHDQFGALWDVIPFPNHLSSSKPIIGKVRAEADEGENKVDSWVAIITSGYHGGGEQGRIAALKITNGSKVPIWYDGDDEELEDKLTTQAKETHIAGSAYYTMSSPAVLDSNMDGYLDLIYAGDSEGTLWKFYYDYALKYWKKVALFNTGGQAITAAPSLAFDATGDLRIYFGTGKYLEESDKANNTLNAFYGLIEKRTTAAGANQGHFTRNTAIDKADLADLTTIITTSQWNALDDADVIKINTIDNGWYFELEIPLGYPAERVLDRALIASKHVFFTTFVPNEDVCGHGGRSRLYAIDYIYGLVDDSDKPLNDMTSGSRYKDIGLGIPSEPVYYHEKNTLHTRILVHKSNQELQDEDTNLGEKKMTIKTWRTDW